MTKENYNSLVSITNGQLWGFPDLSPNWKEGLWRNSPYADPLGVKKLRSILKNSEIEKSTDLSKANPRSISVIIKRNKQELSKILLTPEPKNEFPHF